MGLYDDRILPHLVNRVMDNPAMRRSRSRVCDRLEGRVVEVGFGSGLNVPYYGEGVEHVSAVEPSQVATGIAADRIAASEVPVEIVGLDGQRLDLPDDSFDAALSTWTLCTIPDVNAALLELRRVLKPGGTFHFVEHGHAPHESVARWQRRLEPVQKKLAGGCHLTRPIADLIEAAGFEITEIDREYVKGTPRPWGYEYSGVARAS